MVIIPIIWVFTTTLTVSVAIWLIGTIQTIQPIIMIILIIPTLNLIQLEIHKTCVKKMKNDITLVLTIVHFSELI